MTTIIISVTVGFIAGVVVCRLYFNKAVTAFKNEVNKI